MPRPIINFGSCCIDHVYSVDHFVNPGETLSCSSYEVHPGGKGLNQSIALAKAGADVIHAGRIGADGTWLSELLLDHSVDTRHLMEDSGPTGHANIQVSKDGENAIVLYGGANRQITHDDVDRVLATATEGQFLLLQNEISSLEYLAERAVNIGLKVVLNAAPMADNIRTLPLNQFELLILNEIEGEAITGQTKPEDILAKLRSEYDAIKVVLTLGEDGSVFQDDDIQIRQAANPVEVVDSTGAGDTFTGYFLANYSANEPIEECLRKATAAAGLSVTRKGAASSIPESRELEDAR